MENKALTEISCPTLSLFRKGKARNVYDLGDKLLLVASDRVSAFDVVLPNGIPDKGRLLTKISEFWFDKIPSHFLHHLISTNVDEFPSEVQIYRDQLEGRSMLVKKTHLIEVECVVRGYLVGSGWKEYQESGTVCGVQLPEGLQLASKLETPIFTPAAKHFDGHDENISEARMTELLGDALTQKLKSMSMELYAFGRDFADERGIILADTKFEFGLLDGEVILIDEVLTPDSSRYWPKDLYQEGVSPPSFDKQIVRDYLASLSDWNREAPGPELPESIVEKVRAEYERLDALLTR